MSERSKKGRRAEWFAAWGLRLKGYRILARNIRGRHSEIDIIARRGSLLVFVEVKYRTDKDALLGAMHPAQWQRIAALATQYVARRKNLQSLAWRFDEIWVSRFLFCRHHKNMWQYRA